MFFLLIGIALSYMVFGLQTYYLYFSQAFAVLCLLAITGVIIWGIRRKDPTAIYLFFGELFLISGSVLFILMINDQLAITPLTYWSLHIGYLGEVILYSLAMASHTIKLQREKTRLRQRALEEAEKSNRLKNDFLSTISHELRTPMNGIIGNLELLQQIDLPEDQQAPMKSLSYSAQDMMVLIDRILQFSELQAGQICLQESTFNLETLLEKFAKRYKNRCYAKGLQFSYQIQDHLPCMVMGDHQKLNFILDSLLDNAVKFSDSGEVSLSISGSIENGNSLEQDQLVLRLEVTDQGIGISSHNLDNIFDAFHQIDASSGRRYGGIGLGLTACKYFCDMMQGTLTLKSSQGIGSRFTVQLKFPIARHNPLLDEEILFTAADQHILIVEDNTVNCVLMDTLIRQLGCHTTTASNGEEAVRLANSQAFDLIFMDCQMPVMDGYRATQKIRQSGQYNINTPIIAVTANAMSNDQALCLASGMNDYLTKPINRRGIYQSLNQWLAKKPIIAGKPVTEFPSSSQSAKQKPMTH